MKYQLSSAKRPAAPVAQKPFDFAAAQEALSESLDSAQAAYQELVAAEGRVAEVEGVLDNCKQALESIKQFGLTPQGMALMNGEEHNLDTALGLENLAIESLTTMSAATKDALKAQYVTALEGTMGDMLKTMVERIKAFFAKVIAWLKEFFTGSAKLMRMVKETSFDNELDKDKKISAIKYDAAENLLKLINQAATNLSTVEKGADGTGFNFAECDFDIPEKTEGTVGELGWDKAKAAGLAAKFASLPALTRVDAVWKKIQAQSKALVTRVQAATAKDESASSDLKEHYANLQAASKISGKIASGIRALGFTLLTVAKAGKAAEAPAEPAK